jgi:hypothetical protein
MSVLRWLWSLTPWGERAQRLRILKWVRRCREA